MLHLDILNIIFDKCDLNTKLAMAISSRSLYLSTLPFFKYFSLIERSEIVAAMILDICTKKEKTTIIASSRISMVKLIIDYAKGASINRNIVIVASVKAQKIWIEKLKMMRCFDLKDVKKSLVLWNSQSKGEHLNHINRVDNCFENHHIILSSKSMFAIENKYINMIIIDSYHDKLISRDIERHKVPHIITLTLDNNVRGLTVI